MVCCKFATFVYIVSERICAGLIPSLVVGDEGLFVFKFDLFTFFSFDVVCCLHASQVSINSLSLEESCFSDEGHSIKVDL